MSNNLNNNNITFTGTGYKEPSFDTEATFEIIDSKDNNSKRRILFVKNKRINLIRLATAFVFHSKKNKTQFLKNINNFTLEDLQTVMIHTEPNKYNHDNSYLVECGKPTEIALRHFCPENDKAAYNQVESFIKGEAWREIQKIFAKYLIECDEILYKETFKNLKRKWIDYPIDSITDDHDKSIAKVMKVIYNVNEF